jgi:hypothetical protein
MACARGAAKEPKNRWITPYRTRAITKRRQSKMGREMEEAKIAFASGENENATPIQQQDS